MNLLTLADLHLDFYLEDGLGSFEKISEEQRHAITHCVLAGDLSNKGRKRWARCLPWLAEQLPSAQIFVLPGNHDYYDGDIDREDRLQDVAAAHGTAFLQKSEVFFGRHRFLCCTLWTDFKIYGDRPANIQHAANHMNDYHYIRVAKSGYKNLTPTQTAQIHMDHRRWLEERLSEEFDGETTVITHHAPHLNALKGTPAIGPCYASDLEALILKYQPERWLYGHTHHRVAFSVGRTSLINISIGYPGQMDLIDNLSPFTFELEE
jgi:predicted MPP superfamily phosphohydrolase